MTYLVHFQAKKLFHHALEASSLVPTKQGVLVSQLCAIDYFSVQITTKESFRIMLVYSGYVALDVDPLESHLWMLEQPTQNVVLITPSVHVSRREPTPKFHYFWEHLRDSYDKYRLGIDRSKLHYNWNLIVQVFLSQ